MWDAIIITPFVNVLLLIYMLVKNFGVAIILFTILIRIITHPLTVQQLKGTTAMQDLQKDKRWKDMQEKYKDDKQALGQEQMKLYKEMGINPLGSCLPTIIQFPLIIGLYQSITRAMALTPLGLFDLQSHLYPGIIKLANLVPLDNRFLWFDLGQPEKLNLPFLPFGIPVLAIVVVATTYLQSKLMTPPSADPNDQGASIARSMNLTMPLLMGWMALTLASGLSLYFLVSNLFGIAQYAALGKVNWRNLLPQPKPAKGAVVKPGGDGKTPVAKPTGKPVEASANPSGKPAQQRAGQAEIAAKTSGSPAKASRATRQQNLAKVKPTKKKSSR
jgi:YidC/Oxa1 family membrane protein insertase